MRGAQPALSSGGKNLAQIGSEVLQAISTHCSLLHVWDVAQAPTVWVSVDPVPPVTCAEKWSFVELA